MICPDVLIAWRPYLVNLDTVTQAEFVYWREVGTSAVSELPSLDPLNCIESCLKPASRKHWSQSICVEFRLPEYGPTILTVPPFREKIVRPYWYLINACITLDCHRSHMTFHQHKNKPESHEGTARRGKGWWLAWQAAGRVGDGGRRSWRDSWRIWKDRWERWRGRVWADTKDKGFLGSWGNVTRRLGVKSCISKVWWLFVHRSRYRCTFARIETPCFGLASIIYSQRRWSKSDEKYSFTMYCPQQ